MYFNICIRYAYTYKYKHKYNLNLDININIVIFLSWHLLVSGGCQTLKSGWTTSYFLTGKQCEEALLHLPWDLHRVESFGLQPGFHILRGGVVGDVHDWDVWPWHVEFPLGSAPADGEPVNQLILHLLHLGFPA